MITQLKASRRPGWLTAGALALAMAASLAPGGAVPQGAVGQPTVRWLPQGWTPDDRKTFYTTSQGSHLISLAWFKALRLDTGDPFDADQLARYGYLRNDDPANTQGLAVGFVVDARGATPQLGMTCAACHTGQIDYAENGVTRALRIDGAPASADFQAFLTDLGAVARATLAEPARFDAFARAVLGDGYTPGAASELNTAFGLWVAQYAQFMTASLPAAHPWGPGRLDAFGMIFNRVAARDLNDPHNFAVADAPVSYPFLWNAPRQDHTQWNGVAPNGLYVFGLARNTGEVMGVFGDFEPAIIYQGGQFLPRLIDFKTNSIDLANLQLLEEKVVKLTPPPWPDDVFTRRVGDRNRGAAIFAKYHCDSCHGQTNSTTVPGAWVTPITPVGSDPLMAQRSVNRVSNTDAYQDSFEGGSLTRFGLTAPTTDVLKTSVIGVLLDGVLAHQADGRNGVARAIDLDAAQTRQNVGDARLLITSRLQSLYVRPAQSPAGSAPGAAPIPGPAYEARVLYGIWATAPYLHNGSVPTLYDLLMPVARRPVTFPVGTREFDPDRVGFSTSPQARGNTATFDTRLPGNSNAGHEYGVEMSQTERADLLEYLRRLTGPSGG